VFCPFANRSNHALLCGSINLGSGAFVGREKVADVPAPTALDFKPNGRMLVSSKPGQLYVVGGGQKSVALDLGSDVCSTSERGSLGVAVNPNFGETGHNYLYHTSYGLVPQDLTPNYMRSTSDGRDIFV
jgi:hypothetical protein